MSKKVIKLKNVFEKAVSFRTFILNQSPENRAKFMKNYIPLEISDACRERVLKCQQKLHILGIAEGASASSQKLLPILEKLISTSSHIELRLITGGDAAHALEGSSKEKEMKIPTFIFMNEDFSKRTYFTKSFDSDEKVEEVIEELLVMIEKTA